MTDTASLQCVRAILRDAYARIDALHLKDPTAKRISDLLKQTVFDLTLEINGPTLDFLGSSGGPQQ